MPDEIFQPGARNDRRPSDGIESIFSFLDRVDQPFYERIRHLINEWFSHIPDVPDKVDLAARLRGDDVAHRAAFWELWLHEFLIRTGHTVTIHPDCPDGRRRDFRADRDASSFYVEAHCFFDSDADRGERRRLAELKRGLERNLRLPSHLILMSVRCIGPQAAPTRLLARSIAQAAATVSPNESREVARLADGGWDVGISLFGLNPDGPKVDCTAINLIETGVGSVAELHIEPLRNALRTKARDASSLDLPYVVAINLCHRNHRMIRGVDIHQALVGTETIVIQPDLSTATMRPNQDGAWVSAERPRMTSVSAFIVAKDMAGDWVGTRLPVQYLHPGARHPLAPSLPLPIARFGIDPAIEPIVEPSPRAAHEVFELPEGWPGPDEPFSKPYWSSG